MPKDDSDPKQGVFRRHVRNFWVFRWLFHGWSWSCAPRWTTPHRWLILVENHDLGADDRCSPFWTVVESWIINVAHGESPMKIIMDHTTWVNSSGFSSASIPRDLCSQWSLPGFRNGVTGVRSDQLREYQCFFLVKLRWRFFHGTFALHRDYPSKRYVIAINWFN